MKSDGSVDMEANFNKVVGMYNSQGAAEDRVTQKRKGTVIT